MKLKYIFLFFVIAFTCANLLVKHFGPWGLWLSSFLLIPFDFVARCVIHERLSGFKLIAALTGLTVAAAGITVLVNANAGNIALGSIAAFTGAQIAAGVFYQLNKQRSSWFYKVNVSDLLAIIVDSCLFQVVAFNMFDWRITLGQTIIKFSGGLIWYYILFKKMKLHERINSK